ncbi:MAG: hydroxymethylglutaryl-CoA lyase [Boseongicola sp.]
MNALTHTYANDRVSLREVGLRDGLQLVKQWPLTGEKQRWLEAEYHAGVRHFEIGSFLPASRFPQFADLPDLIETVANLDNAHSAALALNERGAENALQSKVDEIVCVVSATEEHSQANMRRSREDAVALIGTVAAMRRKEAPEKTINAGLSMAFGCSISGTVEQSEVLKLAEACLEAGADLIGIADTVGYAGPKQVGAMCAAMERLCDGGPFAIHLHDTRGMGVANAAAALDNGARIIDASLGGLGGCPFAPGATGNVVFEDIVFLCETMGFETAIDIDALKNVRHIAENAMRGELFFGAIAKAGTPSNTKWRA